MTFHEQPSRRELDVLICTFGSEGLRRVAAMSAPAVEGVHYVVCCQNPDGDDLSGEAEIILRRNDFELHEFADRGLSVNRNHSIEVAKAPFALISDDDIHHSARGLRAVMEAFRSDPSLDVATFRSEMPEARVYPEAMHDLSKPFRFYYAVSFEIAFRTRSIRECPGLRFSALAGIGAPRLGSGEEELFLHHAIRAGLRGRFFPVEILSHPGSTTSGRSASDPRVLRAKGVVLRLVRGNMAALMRYPVEALRSPAPFLKALWCYLDGFVYSVIHRREL